MILEPNCLFFYFLKLGLFCCSSCSHFLCYVCRFCILSGLECCFLSKIWHQNCLPLHLWKVCTLCKQTLSHFITSRASRGWSFSSTRIQTYQVLTHTERDREREREREVRERSGWMTCGDGRWRRRHWKVDSSTPFPKPISHVLLSLLGFHFFFFIFFFFLPSCYFLSLLLRSAI